MTAPSPSTHDIPQPEVPHPVARRRYRMERRDRTDGTVQVLARHVSTLPVLTTAFDEFIHHDANAGRGCYRAADPAWTLLIVPEDPPPADQPPAAPQLDDAVLAALGVACGRRAAPA